MTTRFDPDRLSIHAAMNRRLAPWAVNLELTRRCNLRCIHCYCTRTGGPELEYGEICRLLEELAALGAMELTLTGGEPLVRTDFFEILDHAVNTFGFSVKLFSNLTLLDKTTADRLATVPLNRVETTFLGPDAALHDRLSGAPGSFEATVRAVRLLTDRGMRVSAKTVLMQGNHHRLRDFYKLASELGIPMRHDTTIFVRSDGSRRPLGLTIGDRELRRLRRNAMQYTICNAARSVMAIDADGAVRPCGPFPLEAGNCRTRPLADIWRKSPLMNRVRMLSFEDYRGCRGCVYEFRCGGCIAMGMGLADRRMIPCGAARGLGMDSP